MNNKYKPPIFLLPEDSEPIISAFVTLGVWVLLNNAKYPLWGIVPALIITYFAALYALLIWTESYRLYQKSQKLYVQISRILQEQVIPGQKQVRNQAVAKTIMDGYLDTASVIDKLRRESPGVMYSGLTEVSTQVRRLGESLPPYVEIQDNPARAGSKASQAMTEAEEGFAGFHDWAAEMLERVNRGDLFNMTTNARLLRSLRNLLGQTQTGGKS